MVIDNVCDNIFKNPYRQNSIFTTLLEDPNVFQRSHCQQFYFSTPTYGTASIFLFFFIKEISIYSICRTYVTDIVSTYFLTRIL